MVSPDRPRLTDVSITLREIAWTIHRKAPDRAGVGPLPTTEIALLKQANNMLQDEAPVWFFNYNKAVMGVQPWVHGLKANSVELAIQDYQDVWIDDTAPASRRQ